jgi:hypothetical protein
MWGCETSANIYTNFTCMTTMYLKKKKHINSLKGVETGNTKLQKWNTFSYLLWSAEFNTWFQAHFQIYITKIYT